MKDYIITESKLYNKTSIADLSTQLFSFIQKFIKLDKNLIPTNNSKKKH